MNLRAMIRWFKYEADPLPFELTPEEERWWAMAKKAHDSRVRRRAALQALAITAGPAILVAVERGSWRFKLSDLLFYPAMLGGMYLLFHLIHTSSAVEERNRLLKGFRLRRALLDEGDDAVSAPPAAAGGFKGDDVTRL
jgi:hypothetical protein